MNAPRPAILFFLRSTIIALMCGGAVGSVQADPVVSGLPPVITRQPCERVAPAGTSASFSVAATGTPAPTYQWTFNGAPISGATSATLTVTGMTSAKAGLYAVTATNTAGSVTSNAALLAMPVVTADTLAHDEFTGSAVGWVDADPAPRSDGFGRLNAAAGNYSNRRFSSAPLTGEVWMLVTAKMENAPTSYYTTSPGNTQGSVQMFNTGFDSALSTFGVHDENRYTGIPATQMQTWLYKFTSTASSTAWQVWAGAGIGMSIDTAAAPLDSGTTGQATHGVNSYYRSFGSTAGFMLVERVVIGRTQASVLPGGLPPAITTQPQSLSVASGAALTLTAAASGGGTSWQWYFNGSAISGATSATLNIPAVTSANAGAYHVVVTNAQGSATSQTATVTVATAGPGQAGLNLVPWPKSVTLGSGSLTLAPTARIVATTASLLPLAQVLSGEIAAAHGVTLTALTGTAADGDIELALDNTLAGERHTVSAANRVTVRGRNYHATALGTTTVFQALQRSGGGLTIPRFTADDEPSVEIRAYNLDLPRRDHSVESILQCVDLCRLYKVNNLHLRLNDNEAFVFPTTSRPELNTQTVAEGRRVFTPAEIQQIANYSRDRGVWIMPELEVPGHNSLMLRANPGLFQITYPLDPGQYLPSASINIAKPAVVAAVGQLIAEISAAFPDSPYIHLGCDEVDWAWSWKSPDFQAAFTANGFNRGNPAENVNLVFSRFIKQCRDFAVANGKQAIVWENGEILNTPEVPTPTDVLVMPFDNNITPALIASGLNLVNASWSPLYVVNSMFNSVGPAEPAARVSKLPQTIYDWDLTKFGRFSGENEAYSFVTVPLNKVRGSQLASWEQDEDMEISTARLRLAAMSERSWNPTLGVSYANFAARMVRTDALLDGLLSPVTVRLDGMDVPEDSIFCSHCIVTLGLAPGSATQPLTIRYTTNGTPVTSSSTAYTGPFQVAADSYVRAAAFTSGGSQSGRTVREWVRREMTLSPNLAAGKPVTATGGTNPAQAVDLDRALAWDTQTLNAGTGGMSLKVDLQSVQPLHRVEMLCTPRGRYHYRIELSANDSAWTTVADTSAAGAPSRWRGFRHSFAQTNARYVRVVMLRNSTNDAEMTIRELMVFGGTHSYTGFDDPVAPKVPWAGRKVAFLTNSSALDPVVMDRMTTTFDAVFDWYAEATGRLPDPIDGYLYNGLPTVAEVTVSCGAGCAFLGATGIELAGGSFDILYDGVRTVNQYDQTLFYEYGRNFYFYDPKIRYKESGALAAPAGSSGWIGTGYAVLMRFGAMDAAGVEGAPFGGTPFPAFRASVAAMLDTYTANASLNFSNTLLANTPPAGGGSTSDFFASFGLRLAQWYGPQVLSRMWLEIGARPDAATTQDAVDNWFLGCCYGAGRNLGPLFTGPWKIPVSGAAQTEAQTRWGTPPASFPFVPSIPTWVSATDGSHEDRVRVSWNSSTGATSYEVWRHTSNSSNFATKIGEAISSPYDDTTALDGNTYYYWVKAKNVIDSSGFSPSDSGYRISTPSNEANLGGLVLDGFGLSPSFAAATTSYAATVQRSDETVRIRPTSAHPGASLFARVNGGGWVPVSSGSLSLPLALEFGDNLLEVRVIAQDGSTEKTYTLEVFRNDPRPDAMVGGSLAFLGGANVYTGPLAQQRRLTSPNARPVTAYAAVANRGNRPDRFAWRGNGDTRHFRVEYRDSSGALVSAAVRAGLYRTPERQPGDPSDWLRVIVTPERRLLVVSQRGRTVTLRKVHTVLLDASSVVDPSVRDGVSIRVETR